MIYDGQLDRHIITDGQKDGQTTMGKTISLRSWEEGEET